MKDVRPSRTTSFTVLDEADEWPGETPLGSSSRVEHEDEDVAGAVELSGRRIGGGGSSARPTSLLLSIKAISSDTAEVRVLVSYAREALCHKMRVAISDVLRL